MATWIFEPGHTEAEFRARHMMVTWVRGLFKDIHGSLELDFDRCLDATFQGEIDAAGIWTGQAERDADPRAADFLDVESHPKITFKGRFTEFMKELQVHVALNPRAPLLGAAHFALQLQTDGARQATTPGGG